MVGFALMRLPEALDRAYERRPLAREHQDQMRHLRETFKAVEPMAYRGIERWPLSEGPQADPGGSLTDSRSADEKARQRFVEILGTDHECDHYPCSLVPTLVLARELMRALDHPEEYELVRLSRDAVDGQPTLGFDVGYWGGATFQFSATPSFGQSGTPLHPKHSMIWPSTSHP